MNQFSSISNPSIDPETGEVISSTSKSYGKPKPNPSNLLSMCRQPMTLLTIVVILTSALSMAFIYHTLQKDIQQMYSQFDALIVGVEESERRVIEMSKSLKTMDDNLHQVLADQEEEAFENFWGDDDVATHLQSMKYIGHYIFNQQIFAHTKSNLGNRFLSVKEKLNVHWRVKEITEQHIVLIGAQDKTYTIPKIEHE